MLRKELRAIEQKALTLIEKLLPFNDINVEENALKDILSGKRISSQNWQQYTRYAVTKEIFDLNSAISQLIADNKKNPFLLSTLQESINKIYLQQKSIYFRKIDAKSAQQVDSSLDNSYELSFSSNNSASSSSNSSPSSSPSTLFNTNLSKAKMIPQKQSVTSDESSFSFSPKK